MPHGCTLTYWTPRSVLARPAEKPSAGWFTGLGLLQKSNAGLPSPALQMLPGVPLSPPVWTRAAVLPWQKTTAQDGAAPPAFSLFEGDSPGCHSGRHFSSRPASLTESWRWQAALPANTLLPSPASSALHQEPAWTLGGCLKGDPSFSKKFSYPQNSEMLLGFTSCFKAVLKTNLWYLHRYMGLCKRCVVLYKRCSINVLVLLEGLYKRC